ncbi:citrate synthase [Streptacidiphilus pinicola]|uniref:citrate synthase (unknown stereospecificity) n=1 Tax=Streptacidiphilus pinicola TaxID=2219663 RepID=A0A2X0IIQ5_9ACTN|nr:citrate/2-methylcitrate synthase [Streptacidiphilus pinicola]RAG83503.1 citrate synthase [Streptacidiphilus pinicola]
MMLTTQEAAERLGVKPQTLYAYVSRGLITRVRAADGKGSLFAAADVEALAERNAAGRGGAPAEPAAAGPAIRTGLTLLEDDRLRYRGLDAAELAQRSTFEATAVWLWTGRDEPDARFAPPPARLAETVRACADALPASARAVDRFKAAVLAASVADPLSLDLRPDSVVATGRALIGALLAAVPERRAAGGESVAERLWARLGADAPSADALRALDAALILLADHDMATSTYAARLAASTRANPYAVVTAGLAVLDGPLHGGAGARARGVLVRAHETDPVTALATTLRETGAVPGFGHVLYRARDPRADTLLRLLDPLPDPRGLRAACTDLIAVARDRFGTFPNSDLALALLTELAAFPPDAEETIFALSRTAGWLAHALEEYAAPPLRHRPSGVYTGARG